MRSSHLLSTSNLVAVAALALLIAAPSAFAGERSKSRSIEGRGGRGATIEKSIDREPGRVTRSRDVETTSGAGKSGTSTRTNSETARTLDRESTRTYRDGSSRSVDTERTYDKTTGTGTGSTTVTNRDGTTTSATSTTKRIDENSAQIDTTVTTRTGETVTKSTIITREND